MGARVVAEVRDHWAHLTPGARALAFIIASRVLDKAHGEDPARMYYGGHDRLIWDAYNAGPVDGIKYESARRNVTRHIRELIDKGFLTREREARRRGDRPLYSVNPPPVDKLTPHP